MSILVLKIIASITMFIDHFGATFNGIFNTEILRAIGRTAFPIYAFVISEGCLHTKNIKKYLIRLGVFAIISEIPYNLMTGNFYNFPSKDLVVFYPESQNVFFTLFLGVCAVCFYKLCLKSENYLLKIGYIFLILCTIYFATIIHSDYRAMGVMTVLGCYLLKTNQQKALLLAAIVILFYKDDGLLFILGALAAPLCVAFYNGKQGPKVKWFFYLFYPIHLLLLFSIYYCLLLFR